VEGRLRLQWRRNLQSSIRFMCIMLPRLSCNTYKKPRQSGSSNRDWIEAYISIQMGRPPCSSRPEWDSMVAEFGTCAMQVPYVMTENDDGVLVTESLGLSTSSTLLLTALLRHSQVNISPLALIVKHSFPVAGRRTTHPLNDIGCVFTEESLWDVFY